VTFLLLLALAARPEHYKCTRNTVDGMDVVRCVSKEHWVECTRATVDGILHEDCSSDDGYWHCMYKDGKKECVSR